MTAPEARRAARAVLAENALDGLPTRKPLAERGDPRFAAYVAEFWRDYSGHWKASTQQRNRQAIEPPRVCWRLQLLSKWSRYEQDDEQVCT